MTGFRTFAVLVAAGLCLMALPAAAQTFSDPDRAQVEARIARLDAVISSGDLAGAMEVVPPRLLRTIAERAGATEAELMEAMRDLIRTQLVGVSVVDYEMDLAAATPTLTPDGSLTYLMIPTTLIMEIGGGNRIRVRNQTLALEDGGEWYLIRVQEAAQVSLVRELWPAFAGVDFPAGTTEAVD